MLSLIMGLIYLVFMTIFAVAVCDDTSLIINLIVLAFASPGIYMTGKGVKEIQRLKNIQLAGETCYAKVYKFYPINNYPDMEATQHIIEFLVYLPSTNEVKKVQKTMNILKEDIRFGNHVECKYYKGDINLSDYLDYVEIPVFAQEEFNKYILEEKRIERLNK